MLLKVEVVIVFVENKLEVCVIIILFENIDNVLVENVGI